MVCVMQTNIDNYILEKGYHQFKPSPFASDLVETCFQKKFCDDVGKKYFITINKFKPWTHPHTGEKFESGYEVTSYFTFNDNPININLYSGWDIDEAEAKIEEMWQKCNFDYYEVFETEDRHVQR